MQFHQSLVQTKILEYQKSARGLKKDLIKKRLLMHVALKRHLPELGECHYRYMQLKMPAEQSIRENSNVIQNLDKHLIQILNLK